MNTNQIVLSGDPATQGLVLACFRFLHSLYGLPGYALVLIACIALGCVLFRTPKFPNGGISLVLMLFGMLANPMVADTSYIAHSSVHVWLGRNILVGMITGVMAMGLYKPVYAVVDKWILSRFPSPNNEFRSQPADKTNNQQ